MINKKHIMYCCSCKTFMFISHPFICSYCNSSREVITQEDYQFAQMSTLEQDITIKDTIAKLKDAGLY